MVEKRYDWKDGAELKEHTRKKHKILKEYFREYLITRCQHPRQEKFRVAIIDGFTGAGLYSCGNYGSPLIFVDELSKTIIEINIIRENKGLRPVKIECLLILNDRDEQVINQLEKNLAPFLSAIKIQNQDLQIFCEYFSEKFEIAYPIIKERLKTARCTNVFFNLDQCGYSHVPVDIIKDIMNNWKSAEVLLTFMISSALTYLSPNKGLSSVPLEPEMQSNIDKILADGSLLAKKEWLGVAERIIFNYLRGCAPFVSPFSINNPQGWRYWLMHFANKYRARQVYNDILHQNSKSQAHFGRHGLNMLSYDPQDEGSLYLFDEDSRKLAKEALYDDIPRFISESGDTLSMSDFYSAAYSETPAHSDDIHKMIIENPDIEVITTSGGARRQHNTIKIEDTLKLTSQKSLIFMFPKN